MKHALWVLLALFGCGQQQVEPAPSARYSASDSVSVDASKTSLIVLRDKQGGLEAAVAPSKGGELSGLSLLHDNEWIETLYLGRDYAPVDGFVGKGPFLWPATGRNFPPDLEKRRQAGEAFDNGAYEHAGVRRPMAIHGFARDAEWTLESQSADGSAARALLSFEDNPATLDQYPFGFRVTVEYVVAEGALEIRYRVMADGENTEPMFFSIGNHIAFNAPLLAGGDAAEVRLATPSSEELLKTSYGTPTGETRPQSYAEGVTLAELPPKGAVSLTGYPAGEDPRVEYVDPAGMSIVMSHHASQVPPAPVVLFNLWGDPSDGFYSPEPWVGLQNSFVLNKGLIYVDPGEEFDWTIRIRRGN